MKKSILVALLVIVCSAGHAQKGVEDGSRYGHGADSIRALENVSIYSEYVKTKNYKDAYPSWKIVFDEAPLSYASIYTNGVLILRALFKDETDEAKRDAYSEELMQVYEQRLKYLPKLNELTKNPATEAEVMGLYAHDYIAYNKKINLAKAYELLRKAVTLGGGETTYYVLGDLMNISSSVYKKDKSHSDALVQDYLDCANYINIVMANLTNEQMLEQAKKTKENIDAYFINSGAADCESLETIYSPKIEENKSDLEYLNKVIDVMSMLKCTSSDAYFKAAEYSYSMAPSSKSAHSLAVLYYQKRNDTERALDYFSQAIDLEQDAVRKAEYCYMSAVILAANDNYTKAKSYIQQALNNNPKYGAPLILLAKLYAGHHTWSDQAVLNQCTYYVVLDKLQRAKSVDESVAAEANELIRTYSKYTPAIEDLFMLSIKKGDQVEVKGWINETTTVR